MEACLVVAIILLIIIMVVWQKTASSDRLGQWAQTQGYELLSVERRSMFRGGFSWTTSKGQEVFRITIRDQDGHVRKGYVRVGGYVLGQLSDNIDVKWDS
jgi:hypothetical protein